MTQEEGARHPTLSNVLLVGGGSGRAFKHGPMVGAHAPNLVLGKPVDAPFDQLWKLDPRTFRL